MNPNTSTLKIFINTCLLITCCLYFSSCALFKKGKRNKKGQAKTTRSIDTLALVHDKLAQNTWQPDYFRAKTKIKYKGPDQNQTFNADIRLRRDSAVWVSISPPILKIEVARVLITPDSVKVIDRFNKRFLAESILYLEKLANYPLDFENLQAILLGNTISTNKEDTKQKITLQNQQYQLQNHQNQLRIDTKIDATNYTISRMTVTDTIKNYLLHSDYTDYQNIDNKPFAHQRLIDIKQPQQHQTNIKINTIQMNEPLRFPFKINKKYKPMKLN